MQFDYAYRGNSGVDNQANRTALSFAPDLKREPTFFVAELRKNIAFREAISALHDVVVSDLRFKPKDKTAYKEWAAQREEIDWQQVTSMRKEVAEKIKVLQTEMNELNQRSTNRWGPYWQAQRRFFDYLYQKERDVWFVLDPVITVHPDEVFFECFSQDESSYGRLGVNYDVFKNIDEVSYGTTNIDYSAALYDEFQKIRSYKSTRFVIDPTGFTAETGEDEAYKEVKIDLPDSWVRGFLQVSSAMSLPTTSFTLHPMDIHNLCFVLRRHKERQGPRSLRYHLTPGEPVKIVLEPWGTEILCPRSPYLGKAKEMIRVWGRRRIHILERLIPVAKSFTVHLMGTGLPSFYIADLGDMSFTLGLSGWTTNDWAKAGNFDLMAPRAEVDDYTKRLVFEALKRHWAEHPDQLAERLNLDRAVVLGALGAFTQAGRAIYDLNKGVYRARELSREPLPMDKLRFANPREESATRLLVKNVVLVTASQDGQGNLVLQGNIRENSHMYHTSVTIDQDERMINASCGCNWHQHNKLYKGPCEHLLATRLQYRRQTESLRASA